MITINFKGETNEVNNIILQGEDADLLRIVCTEIKAHKQLCIPSGTKYEQYGDLYKQIDVMLEKIIVGNKVKKKGE